MKKVPGLFQLASRDIIKGFITSILASVLTAVMTMINSGNIPTDLASWKPTILAGVAAGIGYILKNFLSNSNDQFMKAEPKADETK